MRGYILHAQFLNARRRKGSGVDDLNFQLYLDGHTLRPCGAVPMISFDEASGIITVHRSSHGGLNPDEAGKELAQLTAETDLT